MSIRILVDETGKRHAVPEHIFRQLFGDDDDVVPEGGSVRVPTLLRDGQPNRDADPRLAPVTDAQRQAVVDARDEYIRWVSNAWRNNAAPAPVADSTPRAEFPMRTPLPQPPPRQPVVKDEREAAYAEYIHYLQNAWKNETAT